MIYNLNKKYTSSTLSGTLESLDCRRLVRVAREKGIHQAHNIFCDDIKWRKPEWSQVQIAVKINRLWNAAMINGLCVKRNGRIEITIKGKTI